MESLNYIIELTIIINRYIYSKKKETIIIFLKYSNVI